MKIKLLFHYLSYLQYPLILFVIFFVTQPYINGFNIDENFLNSFLESTNNMMIFMGLAISFATLQDTKKTSLKFEKNIWENPKKGIAIIIMITGISLLILAFGIFGYFITDNKNIKEVSFGAIVLGIGFISFLKTAIEVFENHKKSTDI